MTQAVPDNINFPAEEENVLKLWKEIDAFRTCLAQSKGKPRYSFYDGPPFATGLPHYGHILAGTIKDTVTRWAHQNGFHVDRRFGWDCHGLPVEYEIDKTLGVKGPEDVAKMGIRKYNDECRKIVSRYSTEWEEIVTRMGRWIDFKNDYKTMYPWFMESVWWVFKELYTKGLVYKGYKVMPYSTACNTPLSNFESGQNYKDVVDPAVYVSMPLDEDPNVAMIAWTTTPWTLPSNLSLCVNPEMDYVKVKDNNTEKVYIMMEARLSALFKTPEEYTVLSTFKGKTLEGKSYKPLFSYFESMKKSNGAFRILTDNYVTAESGTGVVHQAPYFGEDDQRVCLKFGIITKEMKFVCPVDASGKFTDDVKDFKGLHVKEADKHIIKYLKEAGRMVHSGTINHSYPFCWRSETPLIYKAVPSWFVRVEQAVGKLLECNEKSYWVPDFVKEKRFANWLKNARDWAISRNRYWGTPIPLWISDDGEEIVCVGSIEELNNLTGEDVKDIHRENIDDLTIPSKMGKGVLRRVTEVFDCWFESGSMPYAQAHYPFEHKKEFEDSFPADFIAEGIDQTRGWFYTLLVLSTLLFGKPPFKNLIVNGLILAKDGNKMSKSKKNFPPVTDIVHKYGADALRLYLINSPAVRADSLRFKEEGVRDVLKEVFLPWFNAYRFLMQNVERLDKEEGVKLRYNENTVVTSTNYMDRWILSFTQSLVKYVKAEMTAYRLYTVTPRLVKFVEQLTNWYVRMNRKRLKGDGGVEDCQNALETLFSVLMTMTKVMAPFTPFLTEHMFQNLRTLLDTVPGNKSDNRSVHFQMIPQPRESLIDNQIEGAVSKMQVVIELGRVVRDRKTLPLKYPLKEVVAIHQDTRAVEEIKSLEPYILEELNIRKLTTTTDKEKYGVSLRAEPDHKTLGLKLKGEFKAVMAEIKKLTDKQLVEFKKTGEITVLGHKLITEDLRLMYDVNTATEGSQYEAHSEGEILVLLDVAPDQSMVDEGVAREVINRIQKLRKKAKLQPLDEITIFYKATDKLAKIITDYADFIYNTIKQKLQKYPITNGAKVIIEEITKLKEFDLEMTITGDAAPTSSSAPQRSSSGQTTTSTLSPAPVVNNVKPVTPYVNAVLTNISSRESVTGTQATIVLENPVGGHKITAPVLLKEIQGVFGLRGRKVDVFTDCSLKQKFTETSDVKSLPGKTLYVAATSKQNPVTECKLSSPVCHFANVECSVKGASGTKGVLFLENPRGDFCDLRELKNQVGAIFGVNANAVRLSKSKDKSDMLTEENTRDILSLHSLQLYAL